GWEVAVANPAAIKKIMLKIDAFPKADVIRTTEHTIISRFLRGPNLVFSNGSSWKTQRKIANPAFHRSLPVKLFGDMAKKMFQVMDKQDSLVDITDLMERWTLDVIGEAGFGFRFNAVEDPTNNWVQLYKNISNGVNDPFWFFFTNLETNFLWLFPKRQRTHRELDTFLEMLDDVIVKKRADIASNNKNPHLQENEKDLLTLLIEASKEGSGSLSDQELMSNLCAFFVAGHDTTANALSFTIYYLAKNPDIQQKAREEAISILGEDQDTIPTIEQTKEIDYINMVIKETLRMNSPAVSAITRISTEDTELDGVFIPKGALVVPDIYALHHNPTIWHNPEEFNPERFVPGGEAERLSGAGMCWIPFGSGARQCIGMNFSLAEQRVMLSLMLRKYTWSLPEDSIHKNMLQATKIGVMVAHDLNIVFKRRY
ncbi:CYP509 protein, partial [Phycomyces blakesleeanus NRRL 1555(-)]